MKIRTIAILLLCMVFSMGASAYQTKKDMERIERLLADAQKLPKDSNLMLHFGKQFLNVPYVAHTLHSWRMCLRSRYVHSVARRNSQTLKTNSSRFATAMARWNTHVVFIISHYG